MGTSHHLVLVSIVLLQVACTWKDVKKLKQEVEKNSATTSVLFRCKLLQAADALQVTLVAEKLLENVF